MVLSRATHQTAPCAQENYYMFGFTPQTWRWMPSAFASIPGLITMMPSPFRPREGLFGMACPGLMIGGDLNTSCPTHCGRDDGRATDVPLRALFEAALGIPVAPKAQILAGSGCTATARTVCNTRLQRSQLAQRVQEKLYAIQARGTLYTLYISDVSDLLQGFVLVASTVDE